MSELPYAYTGETQRQTRPEAPRPAEIPGCALVQDLIPLYLDGEVSPESHVLIADHIQQCERCSGYLAGARSVRAQILNEQRAVRATASAGPTVAQVRQPITGKLGLRLWKTLMTLTYGFGLMLGAVGFGEQAPEAVLIGGVIALLALGGLIKAGSLHTRLWRWLMLLTGAAGLFATLVALSDDGMGAQGIAIYGLGLVTLAVSGRWLAQVQPRSGTTQPLQRGPNRALFVGILSVLGALACAGMATVGLGLLVLVARPDESVVGAGLLIVGGAGLLLINQRRGWVPALATRLTAQQVLGYGLIAGGLLLISVLAQGLMYNLLPVLLVMGLGGGLALLGYRLIRPS